MLHRQQKLQMVCFL